MGYNRAHQLNIDNQSPPEDDFCDETWERAVDETAAAMGQEGSSDLVHSLADVADELRRIVGPGHSWHPLRGLTQQAEFYRDAAQSRYDALMASRGAP